MKLIILSIFSALLYCEYVSARGEIEGILLALLKNNNKRPTIIPIPIYIPRKQHCSMHQEKHPIFVPVHDHHPEMHHHHPVHHTEHHTHEHHDNHGHHNAHGHQSESTNLLPVFISAGHNSHPIFVPKSRYSQPLMQSSASSSLPLFIPGNNLPPAPILPPPSVPFGFPMYIPRSSPLMVAAQTNSVPVMAAPSNNIMSLLSRNRLSQQQKLLQNIFSKIKLRYDLKNKASATAATIAR